MDPLIAEALIVRMDLGQRLAVLTTGGQLALDALARSEYFETERHRVTRTNGNERIYNWQTGGSIEITASLHKARGARFTLVVITRDVSITRIDETTITVWGSQLVRL